MCKFPTILGYLSYNCYITVYIIFLSPFSVGSFFNLYFNSDFYNNDIKVDRMGTIKNFKI